MCVDRRLVTTAGACLRVGALTGAVIIGLTVTGNGSRAAESVPFTVPAWSNVASWNGESCYSTIQTADIDGDGLAELIGRCVNGIRVYSFDTTAGAWRAMPHGPHWTDEGGWDLPQFYETIFAGDLDGDGTAELMARDDDGIVAYSYDASAKIWQLLPRGPDFSDAGGWDQAQYYKTIQAADLDGNGTAEVFARGYSGIVAYSYDASAKTWHKLPDGPHWTDEGGWDLPQFYETIFASDLDGDGTAELMARDDDGIVAYSYDASAKVWQLLPRGPDFSDAGGWDQAQYYKTIQAADLDGNGAAEVFARGYSGIVAYSYDASAKTWHKLPDGPHWTDAGGWDQAHYYESIHAGDLDGKGGAEVFARGAGGVGAYSYDASTKAWSEMASGPAWSDDAGWDSAEYYLTIQAAKAGSKTQAVLLGRFRRGIVTEQYNPATQSWGNASLPYPAFTGEALDAYNAIKAGLGLAQPIRSFYGTASQGTLNQYGSDTDGIFSLKRPRSINRKVWKTVTDQIGTELKWAGQVAGAFASNKALINEVFLSDDLSLSYVAGVLGIDSDSTDGATAVFFPPVCRRRRGDGGRLGDGGRGGDHHSGRAGHRGRYRSGHAGRHRDRGVCQTRWRSRDRFPTRDHRQCQ